MRARVLSLVIGLACLTACPSDPPDPSNSSGWQVVADQLPGALFAVRGTSADDVWIVGADRGGGAGPTALHWSGSAWTEHDVAVASGDLYWVHPFADGPTFLAGTSGQILRYDGAFSVMDTPSEQDVWGLWGPAADDLWAVGGDASGAGVGFIWRYDGDAWTAVDIAALPATPAWFKVWGSSATDVYFCGMDGALARFDGSAFSPLEAGTTRTLLTVHGRDDGSVVTAVGGQFSATLVESEGGDWSDVTPGPEAPLQTFGVYHRGDTARAVGMQGSVLTRDTGQWAVDPDHLTLREDLHGVWIDPDGGVWAAGGRIVSRPLVDGVLIYEGANPPATL